MTQQSQIDRLLGMLKHLRESPDGCPWTKQQTHATLLPSLIEEAYETAEIIDQGKTGDALRDELGDVLLQVAFHAQMAAERGAFTFDDVARAICDKLERRYPTIFGDEPNTLRTPEEIDRRWEEVKAQERKARGAGHDDSILAEISRALPALMRSQKLKGRAAKAGWEWPDIHMLHAKIVEEVEELRAEITAAEKDRAKIAAELGDLMFMLVDCARWHGIDAEDALRTTNRRFENRFRHMESGLKKQGKDFRTSAPEERRRLWEEAKTAERKTA